LEQTNTRLYAQRDQDGGNNGDEKEGDGVRLIDVSPSVVGRRIQERQKKIAPHKECCDAAQEGKSSRRRYSCGTRWTVGNHHLQDDNIVGGLRPVGVAKPRIQNGT